MTLFEEIAHNKIKNLTPEKFQQLQEFIHTKHPSLSYKGEMLKVCRKFLGIDKPYSYTSPKYWELRGWSSDEAKLKSRHIAVTKNQAGKNSPFLKSTYQGTINPNTKEIWTDEEIAIKIKSMRKTNIEYWTTRGYSISDAKIKISEFQHHAAVAFVESRKGDWSHNALTLDYWVSKGFSEAEAKRIISQRQDTKSLKSIAKRYNDLRKIILTYLKFNRITSKVQMRKCNYLRYDHVTFSYRTNRDILLRLYLENKHANPQEFIKEFEKRKSATKKHGLASKESLIFFMPIFKVLEQIGKLDGVHLGLKGKPEFKVYYFDEVRNKKRFYRYDFVFEHHKVIIEFDGFYFHTDKEKDSHKDKIAQTAGYKVFRIQTPKTKVEICLELINILLDNKILTIQEIQLLSNPFKRIIKNVNDPVSV